MTADNWFDNCPVQPMMGWGRTPVKEGRLCGVEDLASLVPNASLCRGLGRAYGDAALPAYHGARIAHTVRANRLLSFNEDTGVLRAESGLSLSELAWMMLPRRWFTPVSPGTQFVTLGGMVASDIHGKNHHVSGCFSQHVLALRLRTGAGVVMDVSREQHPELFWATMGGMGLTGHILDVTVQLERVPSPWIYEESQRYDTLEEVFEALKRESKQFPMTVAWIDVMATGASLGRGIVMAGRWATASEAPSKAPRRGLSVPWPMTPPIPVTNAMTFTLSSQLFFAKHPARRVHHVVNPSSFFWVLDSISNWNRAYGPAGFTQYQCVLPSSVELFREFLTKFRALGGCSFVNVFKDCGPENEGHLSFLKEGTSFTLDIPIRPSTPKLVHELNEWILDHGGRVYLAKDAYTTAAQFERMYPRYSEWAEIREQYDPHRTIRSALSTRLMGY